MRGFSERSNEVSVELCSSAWQILVTPLSLMEWDLMTSSRIVILLVSSVHKYWIKSLVNGVDHITSLLRFSVCSLVDDSRDTVLLVDE